MRHPRGPLHHPRTLAGLRWLVHRVAPLVGMLWLALAIAEHIVHHRPKKR